MLSHSNHKDPVLPKKQKFPATRWSLVSRARKEGEEAEAAIEELCRQYWFPIYAYLRGHGYSAHDAEDYTQGFFQLLLKDELFQSAKEERGKLRSLLLTVLKRYVANQLESANAQKRGGGAKVISFDVVSAEHLYELQPENHSDPEKIYLGAWARSLIERAREKLRAIYRKAPRADVAEALEPYLDPDEDRVPYKEFAEKFGMRQASLRMHVSRLRQKFGDLLKDEVLQTVETPEELEEELNWLKAALFDAHASEH